jgi:hypothetical protein
MGMGEPYGGTRPQRGLQQATAGYSGLQRATAGYSRLQRATAGYLDDYYIFILPL